MNEPPRNSLDGLALMVVVPLSAGLSAAKGLAPQMREQDPFFCPHTGAVPGLAGGRAAVLYQVDGGADEGGNQSGYEPAQVVGVGGGPADKGLDDV